MALVSCRECSKDVSSEAKTCPHCGIESPATTLESRNLVNKGDIKKPRESNNGGEKTVSPETPSLAAGKQVDCNCCGCSVLVGSLKCPSCGELFPWTTTLGVFFAAIFLFSMALAGGYLVFLSGESDPINSSLNEKLDDNRIIKVSADKYGAAWSGIMRKSNPNILGRYGDSSLDSKSRLLSIGFIPNDLYISRVKSWSHTEVKQWLSPICPGKHEQIYKLSVEYDFSIEIMSYTKNGDFLQLWPCFY